MENHISALKSICLNVTQLLLLTFHSLRQVTQSWLTSRRKGVLSYHESEDNIWK